jgi:origin recognition complex subunit 3
MDPEGLEDALDLSRDRAQNQVRCDFDLGFTWNGKCRFANAFQGVYIYQPAKPGKATSERPSKRRKVSSTDSRGQSADVQCFVPLLNGEENAESAQLRYETYKQLWSAQEDKIQVRIIRPSLQVIAHSR